MATSDLPLPDAPDLPARVEPTTELDPRPGANLTELLVEGVELTDGNLREATLRDVVAADGSWANLDAERARLTRVEVRRVRATGARFTGASLRDVTFVECRLDLASFRFAELERVTFDRCRLEEADF